MGINRPKIEILKNNLVEKETVFVGYRTKKLHDIESKILSFNMESSEEVSEVTCGSRSVAEKADLEAFVACIKLLKHEYRDRMEIPRTVIKLFHLYSPKKGYTAYIDLIKVLCILLEKADKNILNYLVSIITPPFTEDCSHDKLRMEEVTQILGEPMLCTPILHSSIKPGGDLGNELQSPIVVSNPTNSTYCSTDWETFVGEPTRQGFEICFTKSEKHSFYGEVKLETENDDDDDNEQNSKLFDVTLHVSKQSETNSDSADEIVKPYSKSADELDLTSSQGSLQCSVQKFLARANLLHESGADESTVQRTIKSEENVHSSSVEDQFEVSAEASVKAEFLHMPIVVEPEPVHVPTTTSEAVFSSASVDKVFTADNLVKTDDGATSNEALTDICCSEDDDVCTLSEAADVSQSVQSSCTREEEAAIKSCNQENSLEKVGALSTEPLKSTCEASKSTGEENVIEQHIAEVQSLETTDTEVQTEQLNKTGGEIVDGSKTLSWSNDDLLQSEFFPKFPGAEWTVENMKKAFNIECLDFTDEETEKGNTHDSVSTDKSKESCVNKPQNLKPRPLGRPCKKQKQNKSVKSKKTNVQKSSPQQNTNAATGRQRSRKSPHAKQTGGKNNASAPEFDVTKIQQPGSPFVATSLANSDTVSMAIHPNSLDHRDSTGSPAQANNQKPSKHGEGVSIKGAVGPIPHNSGSCFARVPTPVSVGAPGPGMFIHGTRFYAQPRFTDGRHIPFVVNQNYLASAYRYQQVMNNTDAQKANVAHAAGIGSGPSSGGTTENNAEWMMMQARAQWRNVAGFSPFSTISFPERARLYERGPMVQSPGAAAKGYFDPSLSMMTREMNCQTWPHYSTYGTFSRPIPSVGVNFPSGPPAVFMSPPDLSVKRNCEEIPVESTSTVLDANGEVPQAKNKRRKLEDIVDRLKDSEKL